MQDSEGRFAFRVYTDKDDNTPLVAIDDIIEWLGIEGYSSMADELTLMKLSYSTDIALGNISEDSASA